MEVEKINLETNLTGAKKIISDFHRDFPMTTWKFHQKKRLSQLIFFYRHLRPRAQIQYLRTTSKSVRALFWVTQVKPFLMIKQTHSFLTYDCIFRMNFGNFSSQRAKPESELRQILHHIKTSRQQHNNCRTDFENTS